MSHNPEVMLVIISKKHVTYLHNLCKSS